MVSFKLGNTGKVSKRKLGWFEETQQKGFEETQQKGFMARRMICGTCNVVLLKRQGTELGKSSEGPACDALDPELQFIKRKIQGEK